MGRGDFVCGLQILSTLNVSACPIALVRSSGSCCQESLLHLLSYSNRHSQPCLHGAPTRTRETVRIRTDKYCARRHSSRSSPNFGLNSASYLQAIGSPFLRCHYKPCVYPEVSSYDPQPEAVLRATNSASTSRELAFVQFGNTPIFQRCPHDGS